MIDFLKGHPSHDLLATEAVRIATNSLLGRERDLDQSDQDRHPLTYGSDQGSLSLRSQIACWTRESHDIPADCINLTNGASYGIAHALSVLTSPLTGQTRQAFVVTPTYFLINSIFLDAGFKGKITAVREVAGQGLDLDLLEQQLIYHESKQCKPESKFENPLRKNRIYRYVMYLVPTFSNPSGSIVPLSCRLALIKLARKYDILVLCDDVYDKLHYSSSDEFRPPCRLVTLDRETLTAGVDGTVVSVCTFSKLLGPGIRLGWQETAKPDLASEILAKSGAVRSGGTPAQLSSMIVGEMFRLDLVDPVVTFVRQTLGKRANALVDALSTHLPTAQVQGSGGGYFMWVEVPGIDARVVVNTCRARGVILAGGDMFEVEGDHRGWGDTHYRLSLSYLSCEQIKEGVAIWARVIESLRG